MKSHDDSSTKHLPGISTGKPKLRHSSWAKLLSQNKSNIFDKGSTILPELHVNCKPVRLRVKRTRQSSYDPVEYFEKFVKQCGKETGNINETRQREDSKIEGELFGRILDAGRAMEGPTTSDSASQTLSSVSQIPKLLSNHKRGDEVNRLPPLTDTSPSKVEKTPDEEVYIRRQSKVQRDSFAIKTNGDIDWQNIFVNGGFRPCESRDLPTRGELNLLKYKTWDNEGPTYCIAKCAKYFGLESEISKGKIVPEKEELQKRYTSISPTYKFYPLRVLNHHKSFSPLPNSPETLRYSPENPRRWYHLCNSCTVPPVTPASSMFRSSPLEWSPLHHKESKNTLSELAEMSVGGQTTDEGIGSPTESELEF